MADYQTRLVPYCKPCNSHKHWPGDCPRKIPPVIDEAVALWESAPGAVSTKAIAVKPRANGADLIIVKLDAANRLLMEAKTAQQANTVIAVASAAEVFAKQQKLGEEAIGYAHSIKVYALRKLGQILKTTKRAAARFHEGNKKVPSSNNAPTLADFGIDKKVSSLAQKIADLPEEKVAALAAKVETIHGAHVGHNSGDNEWYTPPEIIQAAKRVMGGIDLDPATSNEAQEIIQATEFYTAGSNHALTVPWDGRVWLNPPYAQPLCSQFITKLISEKGVDQAVVLVNNATETEWGQALLGWSDALCFPNGRIIFWHSGKVSRPLQGQMICYRGKRTARFLKEFQAFGVCLVKAK